MSTFTREKQLAFGSLIGSMLATVQREHSLSHAEVAQLVLTIAASRAVEAKWDRELFAFQALDTFEVLLEQIGNVPPLLLRPPS